MSDDGSDQSKTWLERLSQVFSGEPSSRSDLIELLRSNYDVLIPTLEALSDALPDLGFQNLTV